MGLASGFETADAGQLPDTGKFGAAAHERHRASFQRETPVVPIVFCPPEGPACLSGYRL